MSAILITWVGGADLAAISQSDKVGLGPVAQAVQERSFGEIMLLCNYAKKDGLKYVKWLRTRTRARITLKHVALSSPTNFEGIYAAAIGTLTKIQEEKGKDVDLTFHLSPGTPAMAAVWIIIGKARCPAELIESSREKGVQTVSIPFDIAADFIPDLLRRSDKALEKLSAGLPPEAPDFANIIHRSHEMKKVITQARRVAPRLLPVIIEGESGTGKELLARAIHQSSLRNEKPFVAVNCGAISKDLVESELFGHEKGAFTGALTRRAGLFEAAQSGTLFLDEIGELSLDLQVKLLRVLQEKEIVRVGGTKPVKVDVRVIAATNRSLVDEIVKGSFREDLFYRLAVAIIRIPPLRDRFGDISVLIDALLDQVNNESDTQYGFKRKKLSAGARRELLHHSWPGNVRELLNTLRRAIVWSDSDTISAEDIRRALLRFPTGTVQKDHILSRPVETGLNLKEIIAEVSKHYLEKAIRETRGNKTKAAQLLGFSHYQTFDKWLQKHRVKY